MDSPARPPHPVSLLADVLGCAALGALGAVVLFAPRLGEMGGEMEARILRVGVAILAVLCGYLWLVVRRSRRQLNRVEDLLTDVRFGAGTRRDREAVDILVRALRTPDERARETALRTLKKISGFDLGAEPEAWEQWWKAARSTFVRPGAPPVLGKKK